MTQCSMHGIHIVVCGSIRESHSQSRVLGDAEKRRVVVVNRNVEKLCTHGDVYVVGSVITLRPV